MSKAKGNQVGEVTADQVAVALGMEGADVSPDVVPEFGQPGLNTPRVGPTLPEVMQAVGADPNSLTSDPKALEYVSTAPVVAQQIGYDFQKEGEIRGFAETAAALSNSIVSQYASAEYKEQLKGIAEKAKHIAAPDVTAWIDGRRHTLSHQVISVPAGLDREKSLEALEALTDMETVIEVCKCARSAGPSFVSQPLVWLSQVLAFEAKRRDIQENFPKNLPFQADVDGDLRAALPTTLAKLFSSETAHDIQVVARMNNVNMLYVFRVLVKRVCAARQTVVRPKADAKSKYNDILPES